MEEKALNLFAEIVANGIVAISGFLIVSLLFYIVVRILDKIFGID